ncbi:4-hydroxy-3-methylbut-2-enyl diphosphate reductase, partial [Candidatus Dependentiae bacterium]|nr:4-hydroxy-3-methylbut-2-enyl diphosphate reductase [Candidatus Dependentiae bacterium]
NSFVVKELEELGIIRINEINEIKDNDSTLIIRSHGMPFELVKQAASRGIDIVDTTCPFVKKAQAYAKKLIDEGFFLIIIGDQGHEEVEGIHSASGYKGIILNKDLDFDFSELKKHKKVGLVFQTTQNIKDIAGIVPEILNNFDFEELRVYNTICDTTSNRQADAKTIALQADVMLVVGGKNSANTRRLFDICKAEGVKSYHIQSADDIHKDMFSGVETVGISAGASTPDIIVKAIVKKIKQF